MVRELSHYIDGQRVDGTSGRFSDVYDPCTGEVQARLPLASTEEVRNVIASAEKGQLEWAAMNPQRRGRILLKFVDLVNENMDELATLLSSEHGKTFPDAKGDIQRGIEVVEFAAGAPHLLKGEFSDNAGTGIDVHSHAPAARRRRRHHAVQLPGHDPALEVRAGARRRQRLHPQALRTGPLRAAAPGRALHRGGPARRRLQRGQRGQGSRGRAAGGSAGPGHRLRRLHARSPSTSTPPPRRTASAPSASAAPRTTW